MNESYFFLRDDDVYSLSSRFMKFYRLMESLNVPVIYSIIPGKAEENLMDFLKAEKSKRDSFIHPAQHGWMHTNHGTEKKYEFGESRSYEEQKEGIMKGMKVISKHFDFSERKIFVPPYNGFNKDTLKVLKELKFSSVSTNSRLLNLSGIKNLPALISFQSYNKKEVSSMSLNELLKEFKSCSRQLQFFGMYIHHEHLSNEGLEVIAKFIGILKGIKTKFI